VCPENSGKGHKATNYKENIPENLPKLLAPGQWPCTLLEFLVRNLRGFFTVKFFLFLSPCIQGKKGEGEN
jgi:hypothetical protein